jgi:Spy/CpxP family protein refolding chaperone
MMEEHMVRFRSLMVGVLVTGLLATGVVFAQGPRVGGGGGGRGMRGPLGLDGIGLPLNRLNLSEAQRAKVADIGDRYRDEMKSALDRVGAARQAQQAAIQKIPVDEALITSATQDMTQAEVDLAIQAARRNAEVWSVLTPAQREQLTEARASRQARRR